MYILYETNEKHPALVTLAEGTDPLAEALKVIPPGVRFITIPSLPTEAGQERWRVDYDSRTVVIAAPPPPTTAQVTDERDRRLYGGFPFNVRGTSVIFDSDDVSLKRITGAATLAGFAINAGASAGDYRWHGGPEDFLWIAHDNSTFRLDALEMLSLGKEASRWESTHIFAAHILKSSPEIPSDFTDDKYWIAPLSSN